jgi:hypothetical protein
MFSLLHDYSVDGHSVDHSESFKISREAAAGKLGLDPTAASETPRYNQTDRKEIHPNRYKTYNSNYEIPASSPDKIALPATNRARIARTKRSSQQRYEEP